MIRSKIHAMLAVALIAGLAVTASADEKYPYRGDYPDVKTIETYDLFLGLESGEFVVVDVRSKLEYDVIHIDGAHHIAVSQKTFAGEIADLVAANPGRNVAFYCNGTTCLKSYKAAQEAMAAGFDNVYAFDAGIPEWASVWPQSTLLLGKAITDPDKQLLKKSYFQGKCLDFAAFQTKAAEPNAMVIDVRDHIQKSGDLPGITGARGIPLDVFIPNFVARKENQDKTLLIFDQVGKQIKWLQYYLEEYGYSDYHFLEGGATQVLKGQEYRS
ncbi:MAG: rhodanese-like domain-containing protein [Candidatus Krumholzibacteriia bacterium]